MDFIYNANCHYHCTLHHKLIIQIEIALWVSFSVNNLVNGPTLMCPPCSSSTSTCSLAWLHSFQTGRLQLEEHPLCHPALKASGPFPKPCPHSPAWYPPPRMRKHLAVVGGRDEVCNAQFKKGTKGFKCIYSKWKQESRESFHSVLRRPNISYQRTKHF